jgi:hypothetical protein
VLDSTIVILLHLELELKVFNSRAREKNSRKERKGRSSKFHPAEVP